MTEADLIAAVDAILAPLGARPADGEEFRDPPLDVLRYFVRPTRLHWLPLIGRALGVVAVVREPADLRLETSGYTQLAARVARAANDRFPPWPRGIGLTLGLTFVVITHQPIAPQDDDRLAKALRPSGHRRRVVPLGWLRVNLDQDGLALALLGGPGDAFPEPVALADGLALRLRRYVPLFEAGG